MRRNYGVNIVAIRDDETGELQVAPGGDYVMKDTDTLFLLGEDQATGVVLRL